LGEAAKTAVNAAVYHIMDINQHNRLTSTKQPQLLRLHQLSITNILTTTFDNFYGAQLRFSSLCFLSPLLSIPISLPLLFYSHLFCDHG